MPSAKISEYNVDVYKLKINDGGSIDFTAGDGLTPATTGQFNFYGNLNVVGTQTTIETAELSITDKTISVNVGETGNGVSVGTDATKTAGLIVDRGNLPDAKLLYDEDVLWYDSRQGGTDANKGGWVFKDANNQTIGIFTNFVGTFSNDNLVLLGEGTGVVSVTGTVSYERQLWPYENDAIQGSPNTEDRLMPPVDPDAIPNVQSMKDYVAAYASYNFTDTIESRDTTVSVKDEEITSSPSIALVTVNGSEVARFFETSIEMLLTKIDGNTLTTTELDQNVRLAGDGTLGSVEFGTPALFPVRTEDTPEAPTDGVKIYGGAEADGGTGIFFINQNSTTDELISRNKALLYSIIF